MRKQSRYPFVKNAIYGFLVITPIAIIFLFLVQLVEVLEKLAVPLGLKSGMSVILVIGIAIVLVLLFSIVVGSIVNRLMIPFSMTESGSKEGLLLITIHAG